MLYLGGDDRPIGRAKAQELLAQEPKVLRHTNAWVDDSELCLKVECRLRDGTTVAVKMSYCWDDRQFAGQYYFMDITQWLLTNNWLRFYKFVQARFVEVLQQHATNDYDL